jgi:hypothetical protein
MSKVRSLSSFFDRFKKDDGESDNDSVNSSDDHLYESEWEEQQQHTMGRRVATESLDHDIVKFFGDDFDDFGFQVFLEDKSSHLDHVMSFSSHVPEPGAMSPASKALSAISVLYGDDGFPVPRELPLAEPDLDIEQNNSSLARFLQRAKSDVAETQSPAPPRRRVRSPRRHSSEVIVRDNMPQQEYQRPASRKQKKVSKSENYAEKSDSLIVNTTTTPVHMMTIPIEEELPEELAGKVASFDFVVETTTRTANEADDEVPSMALPQEPRVRSSFSPARRSSSAGSTTPRVVGSTTPRVVAPRATTTLKSPPRSASRSSTRPRSSSQSAPRSSSRTTQRSSSLQSTPRSSSRSTPSEAAPKTASQSTPTSGIEISSSPAPKIQIPMEPLEVDCGQVANTEKKNRSGPSISKPSSSKPSSSSKRIATEKHIRWCGHGVRWTVVAVLAAIAGSVFSIMAHRSTAFARLATPMNVAPIYQPVDTIGMFQMEVCFNETLSADDETGCHVFPLTSRDISDNMFDLSRIFLTLATLFGSFFTLFLISAVFWESINLKPIGLGFLAIYFFQSFSMLFFDTEICSGHSCKLGPGCAFCIGASLCWIVACVAVAKMDNFKIRANRERRQAARRARREERRRRYQELELKQRCTAAPLTTRTVASLSTTSTSDSSSGLTPTSTCNDYDVISPFPMKYNRTESTGTGSTGTGSMYEC